MMFFLYLPLSLIGQCLAYPLVPVAVLLCDDNGRLPRLFRWLETHDALGWAGPQSEPATRATTARWGRKAGLIHYLCRNKAYTLRYWLRARINPEMQRFESGVSVPNRWGYSYWKGEIGPYWEFQPRFGFGKFHIYLRIGWKLKPYFDSEGPYLPSAGMFQGLSIRSDDWDDFNEG